MTIAAPPRFNFQTTPGFPGELIVFRLPSER